VLRRLAVATVAVAGLLAPTACGSNFGAQTDQLYQPAVGTNSRTGSVWALDMAVVTAGNKGILTGALINQGHRNDQLVGVAGQAGTTQLSGSIAGSTATLRAGQLVQLAHSGAVTLTGKRLTDGSIVTISLTFAKARPITLGVPVVTRTGIYANVPTTPSPLGP
jgi:hypothetical protein